MNRAKVKKDQSEGGPSRPQGLEKVLTADDKPLDPQYLKAKAWPSGTPSLYFLHVWSAPRRSPSAAPPSSPACCRPTRTSVIQACRRAVVRT